ncbi:hypothetical protein M0D69_16890 [Caballeronia sp. SEWSISQ10-4 2]|uniref:hypothetical protein n=1 Tax=Caballeronia sp. SEWSISQ10-4 2 TaxID=2937438 RepID=UPI00264D2DFD|nr:hypothetical protein [Caballeronia sp. SEWSISQ10-4 2]MDN7179634.1 hypothetical protein [Caballeronia sp. SEWSISQ10-4 2]
MSTPFNDRLYALLPSIYRQRDADAGEPLRMLLSVVSEQVDALEQDIAGLYDNWFIETCDDWVVPYIGDLIGYLPIHDAGEPARESAAQAAARARILYPRRDVANTLRYRRRKGTVSLLDDLAAAVSGWPAQVVEFNRLVATTQSMQHPRVTQGGTADVRRADLMGRLGTASDETAHLAELSRPQSKYGPGRFNMMSAGLFVWRLRAYEVVRTQAYCVEELSPECFTFSVLGNDCPLYAAAREPDALPVALRRADIATRHGRVEARFYGPGNSFALWLGEKEAELLPLARLVVADLSNWRIALRRGEVAIDPERGRIVFAPGELPEYGLRVSYHYGFPADMGGGTYARPTRDWAGDRALYPVGDGEYKRLHDALQAWHEDKPTRAVIELSANDVFAEPVRIALESGQSLEIRAANGARPVIRLLDWQANRPDFMSITGHADSRLVLDGLLVSGRGAQLKGSFGSLTIRHCTFVPGWTIEAAESTPRGGVEASLAVVRSDARVIIEKSILGPIMVTADDPAQEPLQLEIADSVIDAVSDRHEAIGAAESGPAHALLRIVRSTIFGRVEVNAIDLAENCIFSGALMVKRRDTGCMRFCYVPPESRTARRFECQPGAAMARAQGGARAAVASRVRPLFNSVRYGSAGYCQLAAACASEIAKGADDESEMGVFHDLYQPQRFANLLARLDEYVPADVDAGIIISS